MDRSLVDNWPVFFQRLGVTESLQSIDAITRHLATRNTPKPIERLFDAGKTPAEFWGVRRSLLDSLSVNDLHNPEPDELLEIASLIEVSEVSASDDMLASALSIVHAAYRAPQLCNAFGERGWRLVARQIELGDAVEMEHEDPWLTALLQIELPLALYRQFPEFTALSTSAAAASDRWNSALAQCLDPTDRLLQQSWNNLRALLATWIRAACLAQSQKFTLNDEALHGLAAMVRQAIRSARPDRNQMLVADDVGVGFHRSLRLAAALPLPQTTCKLIDQYLDKSTKSGKQSRRLLCEAIEDDGPWVMQSEWSETANKLAVIVSGRRCEMELCNPLPLVTGEIEFELQIDGQTVERSKIPEVTCWNQDRDAQLLEMQWSFAGDAMVDHTLVLAPTERFALLGHNVFLPAEAEIDYRVSLPLAADIEVLEESETREIYLRRNEEFVSLVLPLSLPEWKSSRCDDLFQVEFRHDQRWLTLRRKRRGRAMHVGLWFDLDSARSLQPRTWRSLTIGKEFQRQTEDTAVGFRTRVGKDQWLIFRRMIDRLDCFSVFGLHFNCEFFLGKIRRRRPVKELVRVDLPPNDV